jgi:hypothetical protein
MNDIAGRNLTKAEDFLSELPEFEKTHLADPRSDGRENTLLQRRFSVLIPTDETRHAG